MAFNIVMNIVQSHKDKQSNYDMLRSCEENQFCINHKIVTFEQKPRKVQDDKSETKFKEGNIYYVPTRHPKWVKLK